MTVELVLRYLAKAGLVPQGLPGRRSVDWFAVELKNLILALAAYQPSDAVNAVRVLNNLPCANNEPRNALNFAETALNPSVEKGTLFGDWIVEQIEKRSHWIEDEYNPISDERAALLYQEHYVSMTVEPPGVWAVTPYFGDNKDIYFYYDFFQKPRDRTYQLRKHPVLFRETRFTVELLIEAGKLLADTLAKQASTPNPDPVPGRTGEGDDATPETTKAAGSGNHDGLLPYQPASASASASASRTHRQRQPRASQGGKQLSRAAPTDHEGDRVRDVGSSTCIL